MTSFFTTNSALSVDQLFNELIAKLGFQNEDEAHKETLKQNWLVELNDEIMKAVYASLKDRVIDYVVQKYPDEDELFWFNEMIENSPEAKLAIIIAIENFKSNIVEEYRSL